MPDPTETTAMDGLEQSRGIPDEDRPEGKAPAKQNGEVLAEPGQPDEGGPGPSVGEALHKVKDKITADDDR